jgi:hypothetical protein
MAQEVTQITVTNFPVEAKEVLDREAKKQDRSLASLLRTVLLDYVSKAQTADSTPQAA